MFGLGSNYDDHFRPYLTFIPKAEEIVWDFRNDVAVLVTDGAAPDLWLGIEHLLAQLFQLSVVTVKEHMPW